VNLLLDTHTVLWQASNDPRLSSVARAALLDPANTLLFSSVTSWEIVIKHAMGKLTLPSDPQSFVKLALRQGDYRVLEITLDDTLAVTGLASHHKDPFDRLLIAQALRRNLTILGDDAQIAKYGVAMLW
jgi:PIN domain nuclease of toxin-antitoxin system